MYEDAKVFAKKNGYSSVSELIRDALRRLLYKKSDDNLISYSKNKTR